MQAAPLPGEQLPVEHLPDQVMRERVAIGSGGQQPPGDRLAGRGQQVILTKRDGRGQQLMRHAAIGHADLVDHRPHRRGDPGGLGQHGFGDRRWGHPGARARELERVQGVAFGGADHGGHRVWPGAFRYLASDQFGDFVRGQAGQPQARHPRAPLQVGEPSPRLVGQFLIPQRDDHQDRQVAQPDRQERQQFMGGLIGPVQVLQDEDQRRLDGQVAQEGQDPLEETVPGREHVAGFIVSQQPGGPVSQRGHERAVGQRGPGQRRGFADPDLGGAPRRSHLLDQVLDQPRLADTSLTGDQENLRLARCHAGIDGCHDVALNSPPHNRQRYRHIRSVRVPAGRVDARAARPAVSRPGAAGAA